MLLFLLPFQQSLKAQVKFVASANEKEIGLTDIVQVSFTLANATSVERITPPSFNDFIIVSGPNQQNNTTIRNGVTSSSVSISYILRPRSAGTFTLAPAKAIAGGKQITSNTLQIKVLNQKSIGQAGGQDQSDENIQQAKGNVAGKIRENLVLRLESNKTSCYVGEPIIVSFNIYSRLLSKSTITDAPSFNGFSVLDMDVSNDPVPARLNGREFSKYTLRKVQAIPLQAGSITISPLSSMNEVNLSARSSGDADMDPMLKMMQDLGVVDVPQGGTPENIALKSNSLTIQVRPLPTQGKPEGFKGAVGNFKIISNLKQSHLSTDDMGELVITISGAGNFSFLTAPDISFPDGLTPTDSKADEKVNNNSYPLQGQKTFTIPFSASHPGDYEIPPIKFWWFNPQTETYQSGITEPIRFHVARGNNPKPDEAVSQSRKEVDLWIQIILGAVGVLAIAATLITLYIRKKKKIKNESGHAIKTTEEKPIVSEEMLSAENNAPANNPVPPDREQQLRSIKDEITSLEYQSQYDWNKDISKKSEDVLQRYFQIKLNISGSVITKSVIVRELEKQQIPEEIIRRTENLFKEMEAQLYGNASTRESTQVLLQKGIVLMKDFDLQLP